MHPVGPEDLWPRIRTFYGLFYVFALGVASGWGLALVSVERGTPLQAALLITLVGFALGVPFVAARQLVRRPSRHK